MNKKLSICIPTYNRSDYLSICLSECIKTVSFFNIPIVIVDNCSSDDTEQVVRGVSKKYPYLFYIRNKENIGPALNIRQAIKATESEYVWLVGDSYYIGSGVFHNVLRSIHEAKPDLVHVNLVGRVDGIEDCTYTDVNELTVDLGWHLTCLAVTVFRRNTLSDFESDKHYQSLFPHESIIMSFAAKNDFVSFWLGSSGVSSIQIDGKVKASWQRDTFNVWLDDWPNFVNGLPKSISEKSKKTCIVKHNLKTGVFSWRNLCLLRKNGWLSFRDALRFRVCYKMYSGSSFIVLIFISILPIWFIRLGWRVKKLMS